MSRSRRAGLSRDAVRAQPLYARLLGLQYVAPSGLLCFVFFEGAVALGALLALAELVSWWGVLVLPATVAVMVKLNDVVAGALTRPAGRPPSGAPAARRPGPGTAVRAAPAASPGPRDPGPPGRTVQRQTDPVRPDPRRVGPEQAGPGRTVPGAPGRTARRPASAGHDTADTAVTGAGGDRSGRRPGREETAATRREEAAATRREETAATRRAARAAAAVDAAALNAPPVIRRREAGDDRPDSRRRWARQSATRHYDQVSRGDRDG